MGLGCRQARERVMQAVGWGTDGRCEAVWTKSLRANSECEWVVTKYPNHLPTGTKRLYCLLSSWLDS